MHLKKLIYTLIILTCFSHHLLGNTKTNGQSVSNLFLNHTNYDGHTGYIFIISDTFTKASNDFLIEHNIPIRNRKLLLTENTPIANKSKGKSKDLKNNQLFTFADKIKTFNTNSPHKLPNQDDKSISFQNIANNFKQHKKVIRKTQSKTFLAKR